MNNLKKGSVGLEVKKLQALLGIKVDGHFGPITEKALMAFQMEKEIPVTGWVDSETVLLLNMSKGVLYKDIMAETDISSTSFTTNSGLVVQKYFLDEGQYFERTSKNAYMFLHHTAGTHNPFNTIDYWNRTPERIATEFVLGGQASRNGDDEFDGIMVQAFPHTGQAFHLGRTGSGSMNKASVGLEICNMGYVVDGKTYVGRSIHPDQVVRLQKPFKGFNSWHKYSDAQIEATKKWILYIAERDNIDVRNGLVRFIKKYGPTKGFDFQQEAYEGKVRGLLTHGNVRKDKVDVYPHPGLIDMLMSL